MTSAWQSLLRHPRRNGFIAFNLITLALVLGWGIFTWNATTEGVYGVPAVLVGVTGMIILLLVWFAAWVAWTVFVLYHNRSHHRP